MDVILTPGLRPPHRASVRLCLESVRAWWDTVRMDRDELELRHLEAIAALPLRDKVARWWWINWPGVTVIAVLLLAVVVVAMLA